MIVKRSDFGAIVGQLLKPGKYGLDTETTGLFEKDRLFSVIFADEHQGYYFNFQHYPGLGDEWVLPREWLSYLRPIVENTESLFFIHNAKFDMRMLAKEGLEVLGSIHCTLAFERVIHNNYSGHKAYSLAACAERRGLKKDESVEAYIKKHELFTNIVVPGKDKPIKLLHYDRVPWEKITSYGENDAVLHYQIGISQLHSLQEIELSAPIGAPSLVPLATNERALTKVCYRVEERGIRISRPYVQAALESTLEKAKALRDQFKTMTDLPYQNSPTIFKAAFKNLGIELPVTATGKPCTKKEVLDDLDNPLASLIRSIREAEKLASTYYSSFLYFADKDDLIHANMRQAGTETSRFSYSDPNLQNLPKEDEDEDRAKEFIVRKSFRPRSEDYCFVPIDYKQQEFRMMLDYAGELEMIDAINHGMDVHEATATMVGTSRKFAKTLNFGLLYGMGNAKLAKALGITLAEAKELKFRYFDRLPKVQRFIQSVMGTGISRGYCWNWFGFRNRISSSEYAYILPNHIIQGGCAQVLRIAMVRIASYLQTNRLMSGMVAQVHDELLVEMHRTELQHVLEIQKIMEDVYQPKNGMRLDCSIEHSWFSWGKFDMKAGAP